MNYKGLKIIKIESLRIGLASPEKIRKWAERTLPSGKIIGQVSSSQTVNYKTLKAEKDGLFCEAIFGPIKDFECACGKKRSKLNQKYCPECSVEFTSSRVRRHRLGYISLISPVAHVWYLRGTPSYLSILLDLPRKKLEAITYCTETTNINIFLDSNKEKNKKNEIIPQSSLWMLSASYGTSIYEDFDFIQSNEEQQNNSLGGNEIDTPEENFASNIEKASSIAKSNIEQFYNRHQLSNNNYYSISQDSSWEIQDDWTSFMYFMSSSINEFDKIISSYRNRMRIDPKENNFFFKISQIQLTGAQAIRYLLSNIDLPFLDKQLRVELFEINEEISLLENQEFILFGEQKRLHFLLYMRIKKLRRLKLIRNFRRTKTKPEWMILTVLPVLPPDLRPIIQLDGDQVAVSDLNKLYQKVLFRNNRMKRHRRTNSSTKSDEMKYAQRLLQEAVDALIENGKGGSDPICASNERPLKSLSDMLKGKKGRFRQNLLGKRVDYSGRSVIVVGPQLKIHECGLPKEMAMELFQPFLIRKLMGKKIVRTIVGAKRLIQTHNPIIWEVLRQVMQNHPVLLNRAPTLHRLGIQCFQPKLVDGRAILLHPLVCPAFNADFDGDQMAVHVPLTFEARAEAWKLMWSRNNILSSATGQPIIMPSQDMVLGCYYITTINSKIKNSKNLYFFNVNDIITAYNQKKIAVHEFSWVKWNKVIEIGNTFQFPLEIRVDSNGNQFHFYSQYQKNFDQHGFLKSQFIWTTPGRAIFNHLIHYSLSKAWIGSEAAPS